MAEKERDSTKFATRTEDVTKRYQHEKTQYDQKLQTLQASLVDNLALVDQKDSELRAAESRHTAKLKALEDVVAASSFHNDTALQEFNRLNVPTFNSASSSAKVKEINGQALLGLRDFVSVFSNLLTYFEERTTYVGSVQPHGTSKVIQDCCDALSGHAKYIKPLDRSFSMFHEGTATLGPFAGAFLNFENYLKRLLPHLQHALEEESTFPDCTAVLKATNTAVGRALGDAVREVESLGIHVAFLGAQDSGNLQNSVLSAVGGLQNVSNAFAKLKDTFSTKIALEQQLPRSTQQSKSTDVMIHQAFSKLVSNFEALGKTLNDNIGSVAGGSSYATRGVPTNSFGAAGASKPLDVQALESRAVQFMQTLLCDPPDSVPYSDALSMAKGSHLPSHTMSSAQPLPPSIETSTRISQIEQEKEHFKLECQLLKMKLSRFEAVHDVAGNTLRGSTQQDNPAPQPTPSDQATAAAMLSDLQSGDAELNRIRQHYENRIKTLMTQLQFADGKAVAFYDECRNVSMRYELLRHNQAKQGEEYKSVNETIAGLRADLESTKRNYEEQLSAMTEHVMTMNDQLQEKDNEIQRAKVQMKSGGKQRGSKPPASKPSKPSKKGKEAVEFPQFSKFG